MRYVLTAGLVNRNNNTWQFMGCNDLQIGQVSQPCLLKIRYMFMLTARPSGDLSQLWTSPHAGAV